MRTPAGTECDFYYEDLHRGAERRECRADRAPGSLAWLPADCAICPVPEILHRAGGPHISVRITIRSLPLGIRRTVRAECWCERHVAPIADPLRGCEECRLESEEILRSAFEGGEPPDN